MFEHELTEMLWCGVFGVTPSHSSDTFKNIYLIYWDSDFGGNSSCKYTSLSVIEEEEEKSLCRRRVLVDTPGLKGYTLAAKGKRMPYGEEGGRRMSKTLYWR